VRSLKHAKQDRADLDAEITALKAEGQSILKTSYDSRSAAQKARLDTIDAKLIDATTRAADVARELTQLERLNEEMLAQHSLGPSSIITPRRGRTYAEMFPDVRLDAGGFTSGEEFLATIHSGLNDPRLVHIGAPGRLSATSTVAVPSDGRFSVPTQIFGKWLDSSLENVIIRSRADIRP